MSSAIDDQLPDESKVSSRNSACKHSSEKSGKNKKMNCIKEEEGMGKRTVNWDKLSEDEKVIFLAHNAACYENGEDMYIDPATGYSVLTEKFLRQRGTCCGNACRHSMPTAAAQMTQDEKFCVCSGCGTKILDRFYLLAVDKEWHAECLKCGECGVRLDNELTCFTKDNSILCRDDYYKRFSVKKCAGCTQGISSKELVMRARDNVYHIGCFSCDRCKRILSTGEYFGMRAMRIYCKADYEVILREEAQTLKGRHGPSKGRPRKRRLAAAAVAGIEGVTALSGFGIPVDGTILNQTDGDERPKRMRTSFKHHQLRAMKAYFTINHNPDAKDLKQLSQKTGLTKRVLQVWFQNARAKYRRTVCNQHSLELSPDILDQPSPANTIVDTSPLPEFV